MNQSRRMTSRFRMIIVMVKPKRWLIHCLLSLSYLFFDSLEVVNGPCCTFLSHFFMFNFIYCISILDVYDSMLTSWDSCVVCIFDTCSSYLLLLVLFMHSWCDIFVIKWNGQINNICEKYLTIQYMTTWNESSIWYDILYVTNIVPFK